MNTSRSGLAVAVLSAIYALPFSAIATGESTGSSTFIEVSSCSELTSSVDRDVCDHHLSVLQTLIREKNNQVSSTTPSPSPSPIPETIKIRKISATTTRPGHEVFNTIHPTLFIFDAERSSGQGQPAIYELQLPEPTTDSPGGMLTIVNSFELPDNSAFVGNGTGILPEFVIEGGIQNHYVMSAPHNDAVYHLANIEIDSRNPLATGSSSTPTPTESPMPTQVAQDHVLSGILDLRGAGIFVADNVKIVLDPADNQMRVQPVELGCTSRADGRGTEENFVYRFTHSEFDLLQGEHRATSAQNSALNVACTQSTGQIQLTMRNTRTVISVPPVTPTPAVGNNSPQSSGVLFSMSLWSRENVLRFVDSSCNSVVDQFGNDLSIDPENASDPAHYMGGIHASGAYCANLDVTLVEGAFGLKDRDQAWGWRMLTQSSCSEAQGDLSGFRPVSEWEAEGFNVACNCPMPTPTSTVAMMQDTRSMGITFTDTIDQATTRVLSVSPIPFPEAGALGMNNGTNGTEGLTNLEAAGVGVAGTVLFVIDQAITQSWFYLSNRIKQAWIRYTSQVLATVFGVGIPAVQLAPKCASGLRGKTDKTLL